MASRFIGRYEHSLDVKGRLILPARFRSNFDDKAVVSKWTDLCLAIWAPEEYDSRADRMAVLLDGSGEERARARSFFSGSAEVDLDKQGRVFVPQHLRDYAGLRENTSVLVHGAHDHIEVWNPPAWETQGETGDASLGGQLPVVPANAAVTAPQGA